MRVEVFIAEQERAAGGEGALVGGPEGAGVAEMEQARGGGCDAAAVAHVSIIRLAAIQPAARSPVS